MSSNSQAAFPTRSSLFPLPYDAFTLHFLLSFISSFACTFQASISEHPWRLQLPRPAAQPSIMDVITFYAAWGLLALVFITFMLFLGGDPRIMNMWAGTTASCRRVRQVLSDYLSLVIVGIAGIVAAFTPSLDSSPITEAGIDVAAHLSTVLSEHLWLTIVACIATVFMILLFEPHFAEARTYLRTAWTEYLLLLIVGAFTFCLYNSHVSFDQHVVPASPSMAIFHTNATFSDLQFPMEISYPRKTEPCSTLLCALAVVFLPLIVISIDQFCFATQPTKLSYCHAAVVGVLRAGVSTFVYESLSDLKLRGLRETLLTTTPLTADLSLPPVSNTPSVAFDPIS